MFHDKTLRTQGNIFQFSLVNWWMKDHLFICVSDLDLPINRNVKAFNFYEIRENLLRQFDLTQPGSQYRDLVSYQTTRKSITVGWTNLCGL